jgi:all-trans-retinol 13,14-reductase
MRAAESAALPSRKPGPADVVVIGAGLSGLLAAATLARRGASVKVLEKNGHIGGTSHVFRRGPFLFPMGALAFGFPERVTAMLAKAGVAADWTWKRNHFQLLSPELDIVYSQSPANLRSELTARFPGEAQGLEMFFRELAAASDLVEDLDLRHPDFLPPGRAPATLSGDWLDSIRGLSERPCAERLDDLLRSPALKNFLGSQGTNRPEMSMLNLIFMWRVMSEVGIWFPSCGIHGLAARLLDAILTAGGELRLNTGVSEILVENGAAAGIRTDDGEAVAAEWIISTADYKKTFLELLPPASVPSEHREIVRSVPYTGSEICVYLGLDRSAVDWGRWRADHIYFRAPDGWPGDGSEDQEIEACRWSDNFPAAAPAGKCVVLLRAPYPYDKTEPWRTGEKTRAAGYREFKERLARRMIAAADSILPGLIAAVEMMDAATPLTYRDWGRRTGGSIAGWTWTAEAAGTLGRRLLVRTPVRGLLAAGVYAASGLFLGGVPTAFRTAEMAADAVCASRAQAQM